MEHGVYTLLLDRYYVTEKPIPVSDAYKVARASTRQEREAVDSITREFFKRDGDVWRHNYADRVIAQAQEKSAKAASSAGKRWQSDGNANASETDMRTHSEGNATRAPDTLATSHKSTIHPQEDKNHLPEETTARKRAAPLAKKPDEVTEKTWADFQVVRKAHRAPLTDTALAGIVREAEKAGLTLEQTLRKCCEKNWRSFDADWGKSPGVNGRAQAAPSRNDAELIAKLQREDEEALAKGESHAAH